MKHILSSASVIILISLMPLIVSAQADTTAKAKTDTTIKAPVDSVKATVDTAAAEKPKVDSVSIASTPMNCYKQYVDYFTELGARPVTDGMQLVVIAFKSKDNTSCFMGRVEVAGGKIKSPVFIQTEGGTYKSFSELGKKLDPDFVAAVGDGLWAITNGMSVVFQTTEQEYGRLFFYKFLNKNKGMNKEAPSPADLLK